MSKKTQAYLMLHISVILYGFTAILGKLISLSEMSIVWYRLLFTCASLALLPMLWKQIKGIDRKTLFQTMAIGCVVALHWLTFYGAIKYSNVSVALSCFATTTFFTSLLEPIILKQKVKWHEVGIGIIIIPGVYFIFKVTGVYFFGMTIGLISAFLAALFSTLNKKIIDKVEAVPMTFIELGSGWVLLSLLIPFYAMWNPEFTLELNQTDFIYLIILAVFCTSLAFILTLKAMKTVTAFIANLSINLEPIYGIILAAILFKEHEGLNTQFYIGASIIIAAVFIHPMITKLINKNKVQVHQDD